MSKQGWISSYEKQTIPHWAQRKNHSPLANELVKVLNKRSGNKILEIGVGNGRDCKFFAQKNNQVTGIDIAPGALRLATQNCQAEICNGKVNLLLGDAENLEFSNSTFDAIYSLSVLHSTNLEKSLAEITRVLKPKGKALLYMYELVRTPTSKHTFWTAKQIKKLIRKNKLIIDDSWTTWEKGYKENTKIIILQIHKK